VFRACLFKVAGAQLLGEIEMSRLPKKFVDRVQARLKTFQTIANHQRERDVSEADTVTVVKDILADLMGYDKYVELTSEQQIRGTFCDLAVRLDGKIRFLIEVKSAGTELNASHLRQAINYGANQGIEWVILTNAAEWRVHRLRFTQPIETEEVTTFKLGELSPRKEDDLVKLLLLSKEGQANDAMNAFHQNAQVLNRFVIAQSILTEGVLNAIRKEMRRVFPDVKAETNTILDILSHEVLKRDVIEGDRVTEAKTRIKKAEQKLARAATKQSATAVE
jgi:predicted type IV restriction endonuclease